MKGATEFIVREKRRANHVRPVGRIAILGPVFWPTVHLAL
jgi:hypothetical protein